MYLLLHRCNNIVISKKKHPSPPRPSVCKIFIIYHRKKKIEKYVEFDFNMGTDFSCDFLFFLNV